jgi:purine-binding chemotaxis protein CheW
MHPISNAGTPVRTPREGKYLFFELGFEEFGIPVTQVNEIMGLQPIAAIPRTPEYVKGVINLRGHVIPVVDLRLKFGLPSVEYTSRTCIVVVRARIDADSAVVGVVVDGVTEVLTLTAGDIEDTPKFGTAPTPACLTGLAKFKDKIRILMDVESILDAEDVQCLDSLAA